MYTERTTVGLDVHARSVVAEAVDWQTGQVFSKRLIPYEAGPTGFGLARAFAAARIRCEVFAPSKLERPPGDRVKTDRRDARRIDHYHGSATAVGTDRCPVGGNPRDRHLDRGRVGGRDRGLGPVYGAGIGAYLGLVPSEPSSGASRNPGSITKTGSTHARRLLVEAAWHHQRLLRPASKAVAARKKEPSVIAVSVARELAGWCWSLASTMSNLFSPNARGEQVTLVS